MERLKIAIIYGTKPNFDYDAFKYFILYVNQIQSAYEFFFPDNNSVVFTEKIKTDILFASSLDRVKEFTPSIDTFADHYIVIVTNSFSNNYFFNASEKYSIITTDVWDKH